MHRSIPGFDAVVQKSSEVCPSFRLQIRQVGFFYLGGVDAYCDLEAPCEAGRKFFAKPVEEKFEYSMGSPDGESWFRGYQAVRVYPKHLKRSIAPYQPVAMAVIFEANLILVLKVVFVGETRIFQI